MSRRALIKISGAGAVIALGGLSGAPGRSSAGWRRLLFIWTWNEFLPPLIVSSGPKYHTLPVGLLYFQQRWTSNFPVIAAGSTIILLPLTVVFLIFQRQLIRGITSGAVKG